MGDLIIIPKIQQLIEEFFNNNEILIIKNYKELAVFGGLYNWWYRQGEYFEYDPHAGFYIIP